MFTRTGSRPGRRGRGIWAGQGGTCGSAGGSEGAAREGRGAGAGERFFIRRAGQGRPAERKAMIDREHDLAVVCEAKVLTLARSNKPRPVSVEDLALMRRLDELHLDYPFAGARMLRDLLRREGVPVGWRHVATLMKRRGLAAIYRRPNMSKPAPGPKIYPYLLRGLRSPDIWRSTIRAARIRALTGARPTRLISARTRNGGGRMTVVVRFCRGSGRATPSRRHSKTATPRSVYPGRNPLNFRGALSKQPELALIYIQRHDSTAKANTDPCIAARRRRSVITACATTQNTANKRDKAHGNRRYSIIRGHALLLEV